MTETLPAITGAEFRSMREYLGLSQGWMARYLMCDGRRLSRMENGGEDIPNRFAGRLDDVYEETAQVVSVLVAKYQDLLKTRSSGEATLSVYRTDEEYRSDPKRKLDNGGKFSASWHRMVAQRVADAVPGVVLVYKEAILRKPRPWENGKRERNEAEKG